MATEIQGQQYAGIKRLLNSWQLVNDWQPDEGCLISEGRSPEDYQAPLSAGPKAPLKVTLYEVTRREVRKHLPSTLACQDLMLQVGAGVEGTANVERSEACSPGTSD